MAELTEEQKLRLVAGLIGKDLSEYYWDGSTFRKFRKVFHNSYFWNPCHFMDDALALAEYLNLPWVVEPLRQWANETATSGDPYKDTRLALVDLAVKRAFSRRTPCPSPKTMGEHACTNKHLCWEPCGELGNDEHFAAIANPQPKTTGTFTDDIFDDAMRFRKLLELGGCDGKHGRGVDIGDRLKSKLAFRFWCKPEEVRGLIDQLMEKDDGDDLQKG